MNDKKPRAIHGVDHMRFVHFLKRAIRDLKPLNPKSERVLGIVESALGPKVPELVELNDQERQMLLDVVHHLVNLLGEWRETCPAAVNSLEDRLNEMAMRYEVVPV